MPVDHRAVDAFEASLLTSDGIEEKSNLPFIFHFFDSDLAIICIKFVSEHRKLIGNPDCGH